MSPTEDPIRISPEEAKRRMEKGEVTVLDVVDTHVYDEVPVELPGAVRIAPENVPDDFERLPKSRTVLAYCT